jgi:ferric-dicitrate binding protein FerR (iron transport regulator)
VQNGYTIKKENGRLIYEAGAANNSAIAESDHVVSTERAGMYPIKLSDGTQLWLNPSSSVSYPPVFPANERKVTITGEVYFEVAKATTADGHKKPFIVTVKGNDTRIEVLGTHFNINAYADEPSVKATLVEGSVKVITSKEALLLKPGEQAEVIDHTIKITEVGESGKRAVQASKEGNFDSQKSDIKSLLREIGRWYDVDVQYPGDMKDRHFVVQMSRNTNLSEVIKALNLSGINCKQKGKKLIVLP